MTISIITICLNDIDALKRTRESVITQTSNDYEHVIVDGASSDGTVEYLKELAGSIKWISEPDRGIADAFNKGIGIAEGSLVLCLNAGDVFYDENVVKDIIEEWQNDPVDVLTCMVERADGQVMWCKDEDYWNRGLHAHQGVFVTREAYKQLGGYNIFLKSRMDYDLFLRMAKLNLSHRIVKRIIARFDTNGISQYDKRLSFTEAAGLKLIYENEISTGELEKLKELTSNNLSANAAKFDDKDKKYNLIFNWIDRLLSGKSIKGYLIKREIKRVSIYGAGQLGALLIRDLENSEISIIDLIDSVEGKFIGKRSAIKIEEMSSEIDAVIVTVIEGYEDIRKDIKQNLNVEVISLKEIVASL